MKASTPRREETRSTHAEAVGYVVSVLVTVAGVILTMAAWQAGSVFGSIAGILATAVGVGSVLDHLP